MNYERLKVHPGCLMVFVDETGHEEFADPNYPVFGFGGCAVPAFAAPDVLERPWREMKERHFGGADVALHASDLRHPTPEQLEALGAFFRDHRFGRFAVTMCRDVSLPEGESPIQAMRGALRDRWSELASRVDPTPMGWKRSKWRISSHTRPVVKLTRVTKVRAAFARTLMSCSAPTTFGRAGFISTLHR
jgi:hypothetical protein